MNFTNANKEKKFRDESEKTTWFVHKRKKCTACDCVITEKEQKRNNGLCNKCYQYES